MQFNSFLFIFVFLPAMFFSYSLFRTSPIGKATILIGSCVFYGWEHPWYLLPMFATATLDYIAAGFIDKSSNPNARRWWLWTSIILNLALMSVFKYSGWATESIVLAQAYFGFALLSGPIHLPLPPGISFYTFESISYTADVYRGEFKPRRRFFDYLSFIVFFPHLVAGPIRRAKDLLPPLSMYRDAVSAPMASKAIFFILWGLYLKIAVADNCGPIAEHIDGEMKLGHPIAAGVGAIFAYAFTFQIYADFAAYSLIARGAALLFNIEVGNNFLTPYFSENPSDFWRRWHISLSQWIRDYLFIPLGGNQNGLTQTLRNLLITMALAGLWHGSGLFFIHWGIYHGLLLIFYRVFPIDKWLIGFLGGIVGRAIAILIFFHLIVFGWILFRTTPETFPKIMGSILATTPRVLADGYFYFWARLLVIFAVPMIIFDFVGYLRNVEYPDLWLRMRTPIAVLSVLYAFYQIVFLGSRTANEFIYFAF